MRGIMMHSDVNVARFISGLLLLLAVGSSHQDEIRSNWSNQLYPTNSVYRAAGSSNQTPSSNKNIVLEQNSNAETYDETAEEVASEEVDYDEEYEAESVPQESKEIHEPTTEQHTSKETNSNTKEENSRDAVELYYYYDDDYDNGTNSHPPEYEDYTPTSDSTSPPAPPLSSSPPPSSSPPQEVSPKDLASAPIPDDRILIGEAIVSVVTTKSVVNGTISIPTYSPITTEQMDAPFLDATSPTPPASPPPPEPSEPPTTEDSIIVASVQTSRSISGARFLPFDLTGSPPKSQTNLTTDPKPSNSSNTHEEPARKSPIESTESIIDKLDRVQSELSSGFLTGGFRNAGNALQLDVLSEQRPSSGRKAFTTITTTGKPPIISKFVPKRYNDRKVTSTNPPPIASTESIQAADADEAVAPSTPSARPKLNFKWPSGRSKASTTEASKVTSRRPSLVTDEGQDIRAFLPPGFRLKNEDKTTEKTLLSDILARTKINIASLIPADYNHKVIDEGKSTKAPKTTSEAPVSIHNLFSKSSVDINAFLPPGYNKQIKGEEKLMETTTTSPIQKSLQELFAKSSADISGLLPAGYENQNDRDEDKRNETEIRTTKRVESTSKAPGVKLVFPSRPGGRKAAHKTVTQPSRNNDAPTPVTPKIQKGWPTRATTEFTGWPTPSTTPISIEKLLEAARTATVSSMNSSIIPITSEAPTTPSTTTTTTTVRPTTPGYCTEECEVAGTIRIIGNTTWVPELFDRNTREWQDLANEVEKEINLVYVKSAILRKWYKNVRIDAFSPGSILVDYFVELQDLTQRINTQELRVLFHDSLRTYNAYRWNETRGVKAPMRLGDYLIDPKSTDFVVIPKVSQPQHMERDDRLIPQWAIAVIVIGVGGLVFIIIFGVSVLVNRQNAAKLKPSVSGMYTEEAAKNIIHASQAATSHRSSQDYPKSDMSTIWNETDAWRDKSFESNSNKILVDGMLPDEKKYNVYDSWRSEWNGYYYQPSQSSSKFQGYESSAYSRHPPDYDTNF